jgi:hypothetical protein
MRPKKGATQKGEKMASVPKKVAERLVIGIKRYQEY